MFRFLLFAAVVLAVVCSEAKYSPATSQSYISYRSPIYGWSISYPSDWKLDTKDSTFVRILSPGEEALVGVHSGIVRFKTLNSWVKFMIGHNKRWFRQNNGLDYVILSRKNTRQPDGSPGIDVLAEMRPGGRSRRLYVLGEKHAFTIDAETHIQRWDKFASQFDHIIKSFKTVK